jgi:MYXO-CTERM domain-containing protein
MKHARAFLGAWAILLVLAGTTVPMAYAQTDPTTTTTTTDPTTTTDYDDDGPDLGWIGLLGLAGLLGLRRRHASDVRDDVPTARPARA